MTHISDRMQKHKFDITCPDMLFMKTAPVPQTHKKWCIDVLHPGNSGMHYVTRRYHRMQKYKFDVRCPDMLFVESVPSHQARKILR
jgi:hypothetical protein